MSNNDEYLRFNTNSIDDLIKQKLAPQFPDVVYRGSSANILSEAVAAVFSLLTYQLNRTASNSAFGKTQSIESLIQQTKLINYKPVGYTASSMFIDLLPLAAFDNRSYTIPRYSFIETSEGIFSTSEDLEFTYTGETEAVVLDDVIVKGGKWVEYPLIYGDGTTNQRYTLTIADNDNVEHNSIHVYIKDTDTGKWEEWSQVDSLYLSDGNDKTFEARVNTTGSYDLTFGDGINGCFVSQDAEIAVYYLSVENITDTLNIGDFNGDITRYASDQMNRILLDIIDPDQTELLNRITGLFNASNTSVNTSYSEPETLEEIRKNAPVTFQTQNRLVTSNDYKSYIVNNFPDFVSDALVLSNDEYVDSYMKYYHDQGLDNPHLEARSLYNQINYADACNFNNVYIFMIPKSGTFLSDVQRKLIVDSLQSTKTITSNIVPSDPIYINFGLAAPTNEIVPEDLEETYLEVVRAYNTNRSDDDIRNEVYNTIVEYFEDKGDEFNNQVDVLNINALLLNISGVQEINSINGTVSSKGISFYQFNPQFPETVYTAPPSSLFEGIFVPTLYDNNLLNKITITNS